MNGATPAHRPAFDRTLRRLHHGPIDQGIGVDKHEQVTLRERCTGIARGGNLAMFNLDDARSSRDGGGSIARCINPDNDFASRFKIVQGCVQRVQGCPDQALFVMCGHNEGNHRLMIARHCRPDPRGGCAWLDRSGCQMENAPGKLNAPTCRRRNVG